MDRRSERRILEGRKEVANGPPNGPKGPPATSRASNGDEKEGQTKGTNRTEQEEGERRARQVWDEIGGGRWAGRQEKGKGAEPQEAGEKGEDNRKVQKRRAKKSSKGA